MMKKNEDLNENGSTLSLGIITIAITKKHPEEYYLWFVNTIPQMQLVLKFLKYLHPKAF